MAAAVKYVRKRSGVFQYERRVPERVKRSPAHYSVLFSSKPLYRVSLKTKDELAMHRACIPVHLEFERRVNAVGQAVMPDAAPVTGAAVSSLRPVTQGDLDEITSRYKQLTAEPYRQAHIMADASEAGAQEYDRLVDDLEQHAEESGKALAARTGTGGTFETPAEIAAWVVNNERLDAPAGSKAFGAVVGAIRSGIRQGRDDVQALLQGKTPPRLHLPTDDTTTPAPLLREAVIQYLDHRKLPVRTETEVRSSLRLFEKLNGNKRLDALTRRDFQAFAEHLAKQVIGGKSQGSIERTASSATVKKRIGLLRSVINHAIDRERFDGPNPASGIRVDAYVSPSSKALMPAKRRLSVDEMNLIFRHSWFTGCASETNTHAPGIHRLKGAEYWAPVLAALTGCRAGELGGLMLNEVRLEDSFPHLLIRDNQYRRTKGGYARKVPIIDALMQLGFGDYVASIRETSADRLFPDWTTPKLGKTDRNDDKAWSNSKVIRAFNRTVIPKMLEGRLIPGARQEVTFHSLRGAFKAMLSSPDYRLHPNVINEVVGHAKSELDTRYIGEVPIEETYPAIRACTYNGLVVPPAPAA